MSLISRKLAVICVFIFAAFISVAASPEPYWSDWHTLVAPPHEIREVIRVYLRSEGKGYNLEAGDPFLEEAVAKGEADAAAGTWCSDGITCTQLWPSFQREWPLMFEPVKVLETRGSQAKFMTREGMFLGWANEKFLLPEAGFEPLTNWKGTLEIIVCEEYGCHRIKIERNGRFHWDHFRAVNDECYFEIYEEKDEDTWNASEEWPTTCKIDGQIERYNDYLRFRPDPGILGWARLFKIAEDGRLCWLSGLADYGICMPVHSKAYVYTTEN